MLRCLVSDHYNYVAMFVEVHLFQWISKNITLNSYTEGQKQNQALRVCPWANQAGIDKLKSPILLKFGINVGFGD